MRVAIVGAGPAGLYLAILLKRAPFISDLRVFEQNASNSTFGFGVVFSDNALEFLKGDDPQIHAAITPDLERWQDIKVVHAGKTITIDGVGFAAVGRLHLLQTLQKEAERAGVIVSYQHVISDLRELAEFDLIVGADGINSVVRRSNEPILGTRVRYLTNRFAWFGTPKRFDALTQTFVRHERGFFNAHHYRFSPAFSTFIVECDESTFKNGNLASLGEFGLKSLLEEIFAESLNGHPLVSNRSMWRQFPVIENTQWSVGNRVILGDALHTAHFSIGSGTRLAMEDAIALVASLKAHRNDMREGLLQYQLDRQPILDVLVKAANASATWYETFASKMHLPPYEFALSYLSRTGRMDESKLRQISPKFMANYDRHRPRAQHGAPTAI